MMTRTFSFIVAALFIGLVSGCQSQTEKADSSDAIAKDVSAAEFKSMLDKKNGLLLDVRTPKEYNEGRISGSANFDVTQDDFVEKADKYLWSLMDSNSATDVPVLVYCKAGGRSARAMELLHEKGYKKIYNLSGGITSWMESELPIEK